MADTVDILGVPVSRAGIGGAVEKIEKMLEDGRFHYVFTPNSEILMQAYQDPGFSDILKSADLLTADGIGVVYAAKIFGQPIAERAAGYDISKELMRVMAEKGQTLYLFGSAPGIAEKAKENLLREYPALKILGLHNGFFDQAEEEKLIEEINALRPNLLFVCLGAPKQEKWIYAHRGQLKAGVAIGLGGCLDVYAGNVKRAPDIFIKLGLEWFYRLVKEPKRFFRMLALPKFMWTVLRVKRRGK